MQNIGDCGVLLLVEGLIIDGGKNLKGPRKYAEREWQCGERSADGGWKWVI